MSHQKPTPEELEANIKKAEEELEALEKGEEDKIEVIPEPDEPTPSQPESDEPTPSTPPEDDEPEPSKPPEEEKKEADQDALKKENETLKKNYADSTREAQKLYRNNVEVNRALDEASKLEPPTDEEMMKVFPEWDTLDDVTKRIARENELSKRKFDMLQKASEVTKSIQAWNEKVDAFIGDPKTMINYPELEGKEEDFKIYVSGKEGIGAHFDVLVPAFLHDVASKKTSHKGQQMFERGTGGPSDKPAQKSDKINLTEARLLMKTDYKKYVKYLKEGKIDMSSI